MAAGSSTQADPRGDVPPAWHVGVIHSFLHVSSLLGSPAFSAPPTWPAPLTRLTLVLPCWDQGFFNLGAMLERGHDAIPRNFALSALLYNDSLAMDETGWLPVRVAQLRLIAKQGLDRLGALEAAETCFHCLASLLAGVFVRVASSWCAVFEGFGDLGMRRIAASIQAAAQQCMRKLFFVVVSMVKLLGL